MNAGDQTEHKMSRAKLCVERENQENNLHQKPHHAEDDEGVDEALPGVPDPVECEADEPDPDENREQGNS